MAQLDGSWAEAHLDAVERHDLDCRQAHWAQWPVRQRGDLLAIFVSCEGNSYSQPVVRPP